MARRDTRELILRTSLDLFNLHGEPNVTTNLIADEADISPGNLHYHFRRKEHIVQALFSRFAEALVPLIDVSENMAGEPESLWFRLHVIFEVKGQYRFIYRNLSDISSEMPAIGKALKALFSREEKAILSLMLSLESTDALTVSEAERLMVFEQILMTFTYWIPFADQFDPKGMRDGSAQVRAISRIFLLIAPYLNEQWREEVEQLSVAYQENL
ncbi:MAG TPA: TetR/AcrR family transcriptional regulator [Xanthomonadales bacterium]|nr:TetR/AcrR family transcriptional regulator [Xanthomonadales bacterium]